MNKNVPFPTSMPSVVRFRENALGRGMAVLLGFAEDRVGRGEETDENLKKSEIFLECRKHFPGPPGHLAVLRKYFFPLKMPQKDL